MIDEIENSAVEATVPHMIFIVVGALAILWFLGVVSFKSIRI